MAKVFVSYAHSSDEHSQRVGQFAKALRAAGLVVVIDTDVTSPAGPPEQWPRWMKNEMAKADWVLLYIDATYRRRYDGNEEHGKGLGVTWEGCIVTHELYQEATRNTRFIPVLSDDADIGLIPPELAGANRYFIPSQQDKLARAILEFESNPRSTEAASGQPVTTATHPALEEEPESPTMEQWRQTTVEEFSRAFQSLRDAGRRSRVAEIMGFAADADKEQLCADLDQFIRRHSSAETFDVDEISVTVAQLDALREEAGTHALDLVALADLQDLLMPLCLHPAIKASVARLMERNDAVIISEAVALVVGAEMVSAPADGRSPEFGLNDQGEIGGKGLLTFVNAAIGNPDPNELVYEILRDLAEQLSVGLEEEVEDERDVHKRIAAWANQLKLAAKFHRTRKQCRHYCVVNPPRNNALRARLVELLTRVRQEVPDLVFFELHRKAKTKAAEEIVMQLLKDRFRDGGQQ